MLIVFSFSDELSYPHACRPIFHFRSSLPYRHLKLLQVLHDIVETIVVERLKGLNCGFTLQTSLLFGLDVVRNTKFLSSLLSAVLFYRQTTTMSFPLEDLEVAFRKSTCYIRDLKGNDLLTGSRGTDLYTITLQDTSTPNPICLMAKATSSQAWLWHRRLSHLNFDTINLLSKNDIVIGLPKVVNVAGARENVGTLVEQQSGIQCYNCKEYGHVARECQKLKWPKDAAYHKEKMLLCKQEEAGFQLNAEQADWRDDTDDEPEDQELEAHYMYMAQIQEVTPDAADNSGPIFDAEPLQKVQNNDDNYNVFAIENEHPEQPESVNDTYLEEQGDTNITIDSLDMCNNGETVDQDDDDLAKERDLLASLIEKLKCEIDDSKNRNKFLETSNKALVDKLKGEIEDFKTKNKSLESSNNHFKEANNELSKTNQLMFKDLKKFQAELDRYHDVNYASKVEIDCAKAKGDLMSYKMESEKSSNEYTRKINDLNQTISDMKKELFAHQETISIMSQEKEAQTKFHNDDKELEKIIALENKIKVLDDIIYKTGQSVQTMNMLNRNCKTSFVKPEFLKKAQRTNPRLEYYYADHMNAILGMYTELDEVTNLQCDYMKALEKCECLEKELSKRNTVSKSFEALQKHAIDLELALQQCQEQIKRTKLSKKISQK
ncbi:copia protein, partial [Tanacetum coccineum]